MTFKKLMAAGACLAISFGLTAAAFAADNMMSGTTMRGQELDPNFKGTVNVDVIDDNNTTFFDRIRTELIERPAPQVGQTRAAIEALYGPAWSELAPNKEYEVYTNEFDLTDGKMFRRQLTNEGLRIYEVSYNTGAHETPNDKAVDVKLRVIPRVGDHKNLISKMMGDPVNKSMDQDGQHLVYSIPKHRYVFYNDVIASPFEHINTYFNADGFLVGQEFMPGRMQGQYVLTSAGRYVEHENKWQPDRKVGTGGWN
jgi:hypothetical protein